jgi:hypothetical protein
MLDCSKARKAALRAAIRKYASLYGDDLARISADPAERWGEMDGHPAFSRPESFRCWRNTMRASLKRCGHIS